MKRLAGAALLALVLALVAWLLLRGGDDDADPNAGDGGTSGEVVEPPAPEVLPGAKFVGGKILDSYLTDDSTPQGDLELVQDLLSNVALTLKNLETYYLSENRDFVKVFQGNNRDRLAWLALNHPGVNDEGELIDRWGTPLFFHRESSAQCTLRSAGPDGRHWTEDDIVSE